MGHFEKYQSFIASCYFTASDTKLPDELLLSTDGKLSTYYAPFDYINSRAKVVICGITPGLTQALLALAEAHRQLKSGKTAEEALRSAKETARFAGPKGHKMRHNLIRMMDFVGLQGKLGLDSCAQLFAADRHLLHSTTALRYPVFRQGQNYNGSPNMLKHPVLYERIHRTLIAELETFSQDTIYVPLGPKVSEVLKYLARQKVLRESQLLHGLPHPSGANAERIAYFMGDKPEALLSEKTNASMIDTARRVLVKKIEEL